MNSIHRPKTTPFFSLLVLRSLRHLSGRRPISAPVTPSAHLHQMELPDLERQRLAPGRLAPKASVN